MAKEKSERFWLKIYVSNITDKITSILNFLIKAAQNLN
jgi:hypothetical protein